MSRLQKGFSMAFTIIMMTIIMIVLVGTYRIIAAAYIVATEEYYYKLAQEAGEAGTALANACLDANNRIQTWGGASGAVGPLATSSNCKGATSAYTNNKYVYQSGSIRTSFTVGDLEYSDDYHAEISSVGKTEIVNAAGTVSREYTAVVKKSVTWPSDLVARQTVSGTFRTCAIMSNNVWCWGNNRYGQLGNGKSVGSAGYSPGVDPGTPAQGVDSLVPVRVRKDNVPPNAIISKIFTAQYHSCMLADGKVYCWGWNRWGQLGNGAMGVDVHSSIPVQVKGALEGKTVTDIGGAGDTSCAIANNKVYCWGSDTFGVLGKNTYEAHSSTPQPVVATGGSGLPTNYVAIKLSTSGSRSINMCMIASTGLAYCWGRNHMGQLGLGTSGRTLYARTPTRVPGLTNVKDISLDGFSYNSSDTDGSGTHVCAIASGKAYCWGGNGLGQVGSSSGVFLVKSPKLVENIPSSAGSGDIKQIQVGIRHSCMMSANNKVFCWGTNGAGQLGVNNRSISQSVSPRAVYVGNGGIPADQAVVSIAAGANRGCAVVANGRSYCWGFNSDGQIGDNTKINRYTPTESLFLRPTQNRFIY